MGSLVRPHKNTSSSLVAWCPGLASSSAFPFNQAAAPQPLPDHDFPFQWQSCFHPRPTAAQFLRRPGRGQHGLC